jgi:hypothetical protein
MSDENSPSEKDEQKPTAKVRAPTEGDLIRAHLSPKKAKILDGVIARAEKGDSRAVDQFLRYLSPPAKSEFEFLVVPGMDECPDIPAKINLTVNAVAAGTISISQGREMMGLFELANRAATPGESLLTINFIDDFPEDYEPTRLIGEIVTATESEDEMSNEQKTLREYAAEQAQGSRSFVEFVRMPKPTPVEVVDAVIIESDFAEDTPAEVRHHG